MGVKEVALVYGGGGGWSGGKGVGNKNNEIQKHIDLGFIITYFHVLGLVSLYYYIIIYLC